MRELKQNLSSISHWLKHNDPDAYAALQPGLSHSEVDDFLGNSRFLLPEDFYALYQWHDGMTALETAIEDDLYVGVPYRFFPGYTFNSLQDAVELQEILHDDIEAIFLSEMRHNDGFWIEHSGILNTHFLPIFSSDHQEHICLLGKEDRAETSPLFHLFVESGIRLIYDNVHRTIQTIASCYDAGAYSIFEHTDGYKEHRLDEELAEQIRVQYNPRSADSI